MPLILGFEAFVEERMSHLYPCGESEYPEEKPTSTLVTVF
jgi:hypothetical protein